MVSRFLLLSVLLRADRHVAEIRVGPGRESQECVPR
jgi:hypothetical protein